MRRRHRHRGERPARAASLVRHEDAILFLWNVLVVPRYLPAFRAISGGFDVIGLLDWFGKKAQPVVPWWAAALLASTLLVAYYTRSEAEQSEEATAVARLGVGPSLFFFLTQTFRADPDGGLAALLAFITMTVCGTSGIMARDRTSRLLAPQARRWLVFPAVLVGSTYVNLVVTAEFLRLGGLLATIIAAAAYFFGVIAPRALAGEFARPAQWAIRFGLYLISVMAACRLGGTC